jgi:endonuclease/exonuclease/phosphatase (EEP) superfamily protein YafD
LIRRVVLVAALLYPAALAAGAVVLRLVGERWWATTVALYLPRLVFGAPLPFLALALVAVRAWPWLWTQAAAAFVLVFPLMGFVLPWPHLVRDGKPVMRLLSYNVEAAFGGATNIVEEIDRYSPDIVMLQETGDVENLERLLRERYSTVDSSGQFMMATRFPVQSTWDPQKTPDANGRYSIHFKQFVLDTPSGPVVFYNIHPVSPRVDFYTLRGRGLRHELFSGHLFSGDAGPVIKKNVDQRAAQVQAVAGAARRETQPVIIAGDTNLPGLSWVLGRHFASLQDAFAKASWGFGYTYPNDRRPWMRIDRVLATDAIRFVRFEVGRSQASDHLCVVADFQREDDNTTR